MARHVFYIPDCPECGAEMVKSGSFNGSWTRWWHCHRCGYETERVGEDDFAALTYEMTKGMREEDGNAE